MQTNAIGLGHKKREIGMKMGRMMVIEEIVAGIGSWRWH